MLQQIRHTSPILSLFLFSLIAWFSLTSFSVVRISNISNPKETSIKKVSKRMLTKSGGVFTNQNMPEEEEEEHKEDENNPKEIKLEIKFMAWLSSLQPKLYPYDIVSKKMLSEDAKLILPSAHLHKIHKPPQV